MPRGRHTWPGSRRGSRRRPRGWRCPARTPTQDWPAALAAAAAATLAGGRGSVLVVPDHRDVVRVDAALTDALGPGRHVRLTADQGPQARYTAWLKVLRGHVSVVVGTRAAAFAPVRDLGLVAWWDDGDDLLDEPRAPYPHVRDVLLDAGRRSRGRRCSRAGSPARWPCSGSSSPASCGAIAGGGVRGAVPARPGRRRGRRGRARCGGRLGAPAVDRVAHRQGRPRVRPGARAGAPPRLRALPVLPDLPHRRALHPLRRPGRAGLPPGRAGLPLVRSRGRVGSSAGTAAAASCARRWSAPGAPPRSWAGPSPGCRCTPPGPARCSTGWPATPALVIATPGAEPVADGGYAACLLLDAWASLDRPTLDAGEEALRRWLAAAALTRGVRRQVGRWCSAVPPPTRRCRSSRRWSAGTPRGSPSRELAERRELALPPTVAMAAVTGERRAVEAALRLAHLPEATWTSSARCRWPTTPSAMLLRCPLDQRPAVAAALVGDEGRPQRPQGEGQRPGADGPARPRHLTRRDRRRDQARQPPRITHHRRARAATLTVGARRDGGPRLHQGTSA